MIETVRTGVARAHEVQDVGVRLAPPNLVVDHVVPAAQGHLGAVRLETQGKEALHITDPIAVRLNAEGLVAAGSPARRT